MAYQYQLGRLLYGELNEDGSVKTEGAKQLLEGLEDPDSKTLAEKIAFQQQCDAKAKELVVVCSALMQGL